MVLRPDPDRFTYIIVFGAAVRPDGSPSGTLRRRVEAAYRYGGDRPDVRYLVTGGLCRNPPAEAVVMRQLLLDLGATEQEIVVEDTAQNTLQSAVRCAAILRGGKDVSAVVLCSSRYHVRRCRMLMRLAGIPAEAVVTSEDADRVGPRRYAYATLREWTAYPWDATIMCGYRVWRRFPAIRGRRGER